MMTAAGKNFSNLLWSRFLIIMQNVSMATNGKCNCMLNPTVQLSCWHPASKVTTGGTTATIWSSNAKYPLSWFVSLEITWYHKIAYLYSVIQMDMHGLLQPTLFGWTSLWPEVELNVVNHFYLSPRLGNLTAKNSDVKRSLYVASRRDGCLRQPVYIYGMHRHK